MLNDTEGRHRLGADALGGRVRGEQGGVFLLELLQLPHQPVIIGIANLGAVQHVIAVVMVVNLSFQPLDFFLCLR